MMAYSGHGDNDDGTVSTMAWSGVNNLLQVSWLSQRGLGMVLAFPPIGFFVARDSAAHSQLASITWKLGLPI